MFWASPAPGRVFGRTWAVAEAAGKKQPICRPRFRILAEGEIALGPGKVDLLEAIGECGSISRAAKQVTLSYRRAWEMVDTMNRCFKSPLVESSTGGRGGGGARLTPLGTRVIRLYRGMEAASQAATQKEWKAIRQSLRNPD